MYFLFANHNNHNNNNSNNKTICRIHCTLPSCLYKGLVIIFLPAPQPTSADRLYMQLHSRLWRLEHCRGSPSSQLLAHHLLAHNAFASRCFIAALAHRTLEPVVPLLDETPHRGRTQMWMWYSCCASPLLPSSRLLLAEQLPWKHHLSSQDLP